MKLQKYLAHQNFCSRRQGERYIRQGLILVNGKVAHIGQVIDPDHDNIELDPSIQQQSYTYLAYHKPKNIVTTNPQPGEQCIHDILNISPEILPIGRLDKETSGLILLTNDRTLPKKLLTPQVAVPKTYLVKTARDLDAKQLEQLERGVYINGHQTKPATAKLINPNKLHLTITEGKNRQVRKMLRVVGNHVKQLHRVRIGAIQLEDSVKV